MQGHCGGLVANTQAGAQFAWNWVHVNSPPFCGHEQAGAAGHESLECVLETVRCNVRTRLLWVFVAP